MKRIMIALIFPVMAANLISAQEQELVILHTNDTHGRIFPVYIENDNATSQMADEGTGKIIKPERHGEIGGFATLATAVKQVRAQYGEGNVLLVDGGDSFSDGLLSKLTKGEANIRLMNLLGYEFMALGNHDFDFKPDRTRELDEMAHFPIRGANVTDTVSGKPFPGVPYTIISKAGLRIALLAAGYRNTALTTSSENVKGLRFTESNAVIKKYIDDLKNKADLIVLVSHEGMEYDRKLAGEVEGINIIIGGHSHDVTSQAEKINDTWIVQAFSHGMALGVTKVSLNAKNIDDVETDIRWLWSDKYKPDNEMAQAVNEVAAPFREKLFEVIGHTGTPIPRNYKSGSPFDYLIGRILTEKTQSEAALLPGVGYGITINKGEIKRMDLYALLPHDSKLVTVELQGSQLLKILEQSAENQEPADISQSVGGIIQTPGIEWTADLSKPVGQRVSGVKIGGKDIEESRWYKLATHEGMLGGLHKYKEISKGRNVTLLDEKIVDIAEQYFKDNQQFSVPTPNISVKK